MSEYIRRPRDKSYPLDLQYIFMLFPKRYVACQSLDTPQGSGKARGNEISMLAYKENLLLTKTC